MSILVHISEELEGRLELGMAGFTSASPWSLTLVWPAAPVPQGGRMAAATPFPELLAFQVQVQGNGQMASGSADVNPGSSFFLSSS